MAFGTMEIASVTRQQDYTTIKQQEDNKGLVNQMQLGEQNLKKTQRQATEVNSADDASLRQKKPDAREKSKNSYAGDGGSNRGNTKKIEQVVVKEHKGIDIKI